VLVQKPPHLPDRLGHPLNRAAYHANYAPNLEPFRSKLGGLRNGGANHPLGFG
jgi:hypothetical protein